MNEELQLRVPLLFEAAMFAVKAHGQQKRGGSDTPYVHHCFDVARRMAKYGFRDTDVLLAAILHDTIEDTSVTEDDIALKFSARTAWLVRDLTLPPEARDDRRKKQAFQLRKMATMDFRGQAIKIADKTSNVEDLFYNPPNWSLRAIQGYSEGAKEIVLSVVPNMSENPDDRTLLHPGLDGLVAEFLDVFEKVRLKYGWVNQST